jgi:hypothetical protein
MPVGQALLEDMLPQHVARQLVKQSAGTGAKARAVVPSKLTATSGMVDDLNTRPAYQKGPAAGGEAMQPLMNLTAVKRRARLSICLPDAGDAAAGPQAAAAAARCRRLSIGEANPTSQEPSAGMFSGHLHDSIKAISNRKSALTSLFPARNPVNRQPSGIKSGKTSERRRTSSYMPCIAYKQWHPAVSILFAVGTAITECQIFAVGTAITECQIFAVGTAITGCQIFAVGGYSNH